jgi:hypothetical protein
VGKVVPRAVVHNQGSIDVRGVNDRAGGSQRARWMLSSLFLPPPPSVTGGGDADGVKTAGGRRRHKRPGSSCRNRHGYTGHRPDDGGARAASHSCGVPLVFLRSSGSIWVLGQGWVRGSLQVDVVRSLCSTGCVTVWVTPDCPDLGYCRGCLSVRALAKLTCINATRCRAGLFRAGCVP